MRISTAVRSVGGEHVHFSLFFNSGKAGDLVLRIGEYRLFKHVLEFGSQRLNIRANIMAPLDSRAQLALERLESEMGDNFEIQTAQSVDWDTFVADIATLCQLVRGLYENHPDAPENDASPRSDQRANAGSDRDHAEQRQGDGNNQPSHRDGSTVVEDSNHSRVGGSSGDVETISPKPDLPPVHEAAPRTESPDRRVNPLDFFAGGAKGPKTGGGSPQLDGVQEPKLVVPSLICERCGATKRPVLTGGFLCPRCS